MRRALACALLVVVAMTAACAEPPHELVLRVDTDAVVPPDQPPRSRLAPNVIFDRVEFALVPRGSDEPCAGCARAFALSEGLFRDRRVSIGLPLDRGGGRVRVRLYRSGAEDVAKAMVEAIVALPMASERRELLVELPTESMGAPLGRLDSPVDAIDDTGQPSRVGSYAFGGDCSDEAAPPGTACIPARHFWSRAAPHPQLVRLSSFFVDLTEWSMERFVRAGGKVTEPPAGEAIWGLPCPTAGDGQMPATCVRPDEAERLCRAAGGRLPTYYELSLLLGGLREDTFPWGDDPPACDDAVVSRVQVNGQRLYCSSSDGGRLAVGPAPVDVPVGRDVLELPTGTILHLGGNVSEWTSAANTDQCRGTSPILFDPRCRERWGEMGSSFVGPAASEQLLRLVSPREAPTSTRPLVGFRCVYDR